VIANSVTVTFTTKIFTLPTRAEIIWGFTDGFFGDVGLYWLFGVSLKKIIFQGFEVT